MKWPMRERIEASLATFATGTTWLVDIHEVLSIVVTVLTLAWWVRLWIKNPSIEPPTKIPIKNENQPKT